jgi:acid phosphatase type 7
MRRRDAGRPLRRWLAVALVILAMGVAGIVVTRLRQPAETVLTPMADAYVSTAHRDANYGTEPTLRVDATPKIRSYLRFRLTESSGRIVSAQLRLWSSTGDLAGYSVHPVSSGWVERDITSTSRPTADTPVARSGAFGPGSWSSVNVAPLLDSPHEISLVVTTRSSQTISFDSREGRNRPQLLIWTKPAPKPSAMAFRMVA